jgi:hypothetical protein
MKVHAVMSPGTVRPKTGDRRRETGDRRRETGDGRPETGDRKTEYRRPETGDRRPETGDRRPETGDRRPETGDGRRPGHMCSKATIKFIASWSTTALISHLSNAVTRPILIVSSRSHCSNSFCSTSCSIAAVLLAPNCRRKTLNFTLPIAHAHSQLHYCFTAAPLQLHCSSTRRPETGDWRWQTARTCTCTHQQSS